LRWMLYSALVRKRSIIRFCNWGPHEKLTVFC
jgi:hypothetical protein